MIYLQLILTATPNPSSVIHKLTSTFGFLNHKTTLPSLAARRKRCAGFLSQRIFPFKVFIREKRDDLSLRCLRHGMRKQLLNSL